MFDPGDRVILQPEGWEGEIVRVDPERICGFDYLVRIDVPFLKRGRFYLNEEDLDGVRSR